MIPPRGDRSLTYCACNYCRLQPPDLDVAPLVQVDAVAEADRAAAVGQDHAADAHAVAEVAHAVEQVARGDAGGQEDEVAAGGQVLRFVNAVVVDAHLRAARALRVVLGLEA